MQRSGARRPKHRETEEIRESKKATAAAALLSELNPKPKEVAFAEETAEILRLRARGYSYLEISKITGQTVPACKQRVGTVLKEIIEEPREAVRRLELYRLERAIRVCWEQIEDHGDMAQLNTFLKLQERKAKLLGLDAPKEVLLTPNGLPSLPTSSEELALLEADLNKAEG